MNLSIGALSRETGVKVPTIRYYEDVGLLPEADRTVSNRRTYGPGDVSRLRFIRHARDLGFEVDAIRQLLQMSDHPSKPCQEVDSIARRHLANIDSKIDRLTALRTEIRRMLDSDAHGTISECRVLDVLAEHGKCLHEHH
ncbi:MerR family transcriptional regulator [Microvirga flavescens]|uniref:MerR family transcriptional regulator n=1 Tax=Microvirga flavescens TaxID=2249811 RepID=UPI000DD79747|nr:helix-turn-helix domain-containing protein [Microvirga flavescens]